jgi:hypothetical protein
MALRFVEKDYGGYIIWVQVSFSVPPREKIVIVVSSAGFSPVGKTKFGVFPS